MHKKGFVKVCDNYRGITLLNLPGKVPYQVIQMRMAEKAGASAENKTVWFLQGSRVLTNSSLLES